MTDCTQTWLKQLRKASFRGVPFFYESASTELGRRLARHEYPQRDIPYLEDMGRKARELEISAYVLGGEYMRARDLMIAAVEKAGAGTLVHPYLGEMQAVVESCTLTESKDFGGMAKFALKFIEAGTNTYPNTVLDTQSLLLSSAQGADTACLGVFERKFSIKDAPNFVAQNALDGIAAFTTLASSLIAQVNSALDIAQDYIDDAASALALLKNADSALLLDVKLIGRAFQRVVRGVGQLKDMLSFSVNDYPDLLPPPFSFDTPSRQQQRDNQDAIFAIVRQAAITETVRQSTQVQFDNRESMQATRSYLADLIDAEITIIANVAGKIDDASYAAWIALRGDMVRDMTTRAGTLALVIHVELAENIPALVLSYDYYEALRDGELVKLNNAANPLFLRGDTVIFSE